ncbi:MAG TPA: isochorismatase family protein [Usitatibacter sp.]|nr:isochorismatase family protein [Usitatibacter sp.]
MTSRKRPWDGIVPQQEQEIYRAAGFGAPVGFGKRPALLVIDVQYRTVGSGPRPILEAIREYPTATGELGWRAVPQIAAMMAAFRGRGLPILFPHIARKADYDRGQFADKVPGVMSIPAKGYEFVREVAPQPGEILIPKYQASAFSGTTLLAHLVRLGIDSLVFTGCTTSGCVRASVVDAASLNFKCVVPEDAVYDRSVTSHAVNLFDMASKYADVMPAAEVTRLLPASA